MSTLEYPRPNPKGVEMQRLNQGDYMSSGNSTEGLDNSTNFADYQLGDDDRVFDSASLEYNPLKEMQRKMNHNEAEKKRVRNINKCVEDLKHILDKAGINHKSDKVSTLEGAVSYMRDLMKERDRLTTSLGYMDSIVASGVGGEDGQSDDDDNHFLGKSCVTESGAMGISLGDSPCVVAPKGASAKMEETPCNPAEDPNLALNAQIGKSDSLTVDYKAIWMNNNIPSIIIQIGSGKLLKGNSYFMKLFQFDSMEEIHQLSFFDIISANDLSLFWSEYSHLVNAQQQIARSFVCVICNPNKNIAIPCLVTMGSIMDYEGHIFQVSASFTPLHQIEGKKSEKPTTVSGPVNINKFL